jgi:hypothetical protein
MAQIVNLVQERPLYFVSYVGDFATETLPVVIPNSHRRNADETDNPLVRVVIQNTAATNTAIAVIDEDDTICHLVFSSAGATYPPFELVTSKRLRLTTAAGYGNPFARVLAFYAAPFDR